MMFLLIIILMIINDILDIYLMEKKTRNDIKTMFRLIKKQRMTKVITRLIKKCIY